MFYFSFLDQMFDEMGICFQGDREQHTQGWEKNHVQERIIIIGRVADTSQSSSSSSSSSSITTFPFFHHPFFFFFFR
jgi:hypothetical protein